MSDLWGKGCCGSTDVKLLSAAVFCFSLMFFFIFLMVHHTKDDSGTPIPAEQIAGTALMGALGLSLLLTLILKRCRRDQSNLEVGAVLEAIESTAPYATLTYS